MPAAGWQVTFLAQIARALEADDDVLGLMLFGSLARSDYEVDVWADVDALIVTRNGARDRYFPAIEWLSDFGRVHGCERSEYGPAAVVRTYFDDLRALDCVIVEEAVLADLSKWPRHPFGGERRLMFSRSPLLDRAAASIVQPADASRRSQVTLAERASAFRYEAMLAVKKAVRGDVLIAAHLALGLQRHCLELAMLLRDRDEGASCHHGGTMRDALAQRIEGATPVTAQGALDAIETAARVFDDLAQEVDPAYERGAVPIVTMVAAARVVIAD